MEKSEQSVEKKYKEKEAADKKLHEKEKIALHITVQQRIKEEIKNKEIEMQAAHSEEIKDLQFKLKAVTENQSRKQEEEKILKLHQQNQQQKIDQLVSENSKKELEYQNELKRLKNDMNDFKRRTVGKIQQNVERKYREKEAADKKLHEKKIESIMAVNETLQQSLRTMETTLKQKFDEKFQEEMAKKEEKLESILQEILKTNEITVAQQFHVKLEAAEEENQNRKRKHGEITIPWEEQKFEENIVFNLQESKLLAKNGIVAKKTQQNFCCVIWLEVPSFGKIAIDVKRKATIEKSDMTRFDRDAIDPKNGFKGSVFWSNKGKIPNVDVEENSFVIVDNRLYLRGVGMECAVCCIYMYVLYLKGIESASNTHESIISHMINTWKRNFRAYGELKKQVKTLDEYLKSDLVEIEKMCSGIESFKKEDLKKELDKDLYLATKSHFTKAHDPYQSIQSSSNSKNINVYFSPEKKH